MKRRWKFVFGLCIVLSAIVLSGCGSPAPKVAVRTTAATAKFAPLTAIPTQTSVAMVSCTVYQRGTALSVTITASDAFASCHDWIEVRGKKGEFWSLVGQPDEQQTPECIFVNQSGAQVEVDDGGAQILGEEFCAAYAGTKGWTEDIQAEQAKTKTTG